MSNKELAVKKPSKKERVLAKRAERLGMMKVGTDQKVTLECPLCHIQQQMTLEEYFKKINYGSAFSQKLLRCEICPESPELVFFKVNTTNIMLAGFNQERKRMGISEEQMANTLDAIEGSGIAKVLFPKKALELSGE